MPRISARAHRAIGAALVFVRPRLRPVAALGLVAAIAVAGVWVRVGPLPAGLLDEPSQPSTVVLDRRGVALYEALSSDETRTIALTADTLPPSLVDATVAAEDRRFWRHPGVDPIAILRALRANLAENRRVEGGSTLSQQVAKLLLSRRSPSRERGPAAKLHETIVALRLEHRFGKRELLAMYLNLAAYGNQFVGVERASRGYFGVPAAMVTPAQAAFLAGLPQRPSGFDPYRNREAAMARQRSVLRRMAANGALTAEQAREARDERLAILPRTTPFAAPHFVGMVLGAAGDRRPARIESTLDAALQEDVAGILGSHRGLLRAHGAAHVAVVVLDHERGEWLVWEGSGARATGAHGGSINGARAPRQPGSALKPFTYALAFEHGFAPASVLADVPASFPTAEPGIVYSPRNYDGRYRGPLLARHALAGSVNVPAVALASEIGVPALLRFLNRAGITTLDRTAAHYGLGLTLGNAEVRLDQLVAAYAAFARGGEWIEPTFVRGGGRPAQRTHRLVSPRAAFWITDILSDPGAREFVFGRGGSLELPFPVAVKTGTSQAYHDNWTVGYSRRATVGVWVGNFDRTPLRNSSGVTGAGPIFHAVMLAAERRLAGLEGLERSSHGFSQEPILAAPADSTRVEICALSGQAAQAACPTRRREWIAADASLPPCGWHHLGEEGPLTFYPAEYRHWAQDQMPAADGHKPAGSGERLTAPAAQASAALTIVSPPDGATYLIDPTLRREFQTLPLRVAASVPGPILWSVSGRALGPADPDTALDWALAPGRHRIVARDPHGRSAEVTVTVR